ncbi:MAG: methyltransferase cognate corrinoid protein [Firmicutes bacterium]|nr:methyltransferase cognate corrinoid protein [Bacillota bacterium]
MVLKKIAQSLLDGQVKKVKELAQQAIDEGCTGKQILTEGLLAGMNEVGVLFQEGELFVPEVLMAAKAMHAGMEVISPLLKEGDNESKGKILLATVEGDLHDIGIKLVGMMLAGAGYEIVHLGVDVSADKIVEAVKEHQPKIVGLAALLTTSMMNMKDVVAALKEAEVFDQVKIIAGGAPVTDRFAEEIGAYYAADAVYAVELANQFC